MKIMSEDFYQTTGVQLEKIMKIEHNRIEGLKWKKN